METGDNIAEWLMYETNQDGHRADILDEDYESDVRMEVANGTEFAVEERLEQLYELKLCGIEDGGWVWQSPRSRSAQDQ